MSISECLKLRNCWVTYSAFLKNIFFDHRNYFFARHFCHQARVSDLNNSEYFVLLRLSLVFPLKLMNVLRSGTDVVDTIQSIHRYIRPDAICYMLYENHDIAIAMSPSRADPVLPWLGIFKCLIQRYCTVWGYLNI